MRIFMEVGARSRLRHRRSMSLIAGRHSYWSIWEHVVDSTEKLIEVRWSWWNGHSSTISIRKWEIQDEHIRHYSTELDLTWINDEIPPSFVRSLMISADRDLSGTQLLELHEKYGAVVGDWESASIAWVAKRNGVRTLILRGVSDLVCEGGGEAYDGNGEMFEKRRGHNGSAD